MALPFMLDAPVIAKALNVSNATVYRLADSNGLPFPHHRFGRSVRFKKPEVEAFFGCTIEEVVQ